MTNLISTPLASYPNSMHGRHTLQCEITPQTHASATPERPEQPPHVVDLVAWVDPPSWQPFQRARVHIADAVEGVGR